MVFYSHELVCMDKNLDISSCIIDITHNNLFQGILLSILKISCTGNQLKNSITIIGNPLKMYFHY